MRLMGFILLVSGAAITFAALALFAEPTPRLAFILTGLAVELLGLALAAHGYKSRQLLASKRRATR